MSGEAVGARDLFTQREPQTGGMHTAPELRLLIHALAVVLRVREKEKSLMVETGYDAGYTTRALALSGAPVLAIDNLSEYGHADQCARSLLIEYDGSVRLENRDALLVLSEIPDSSVDLIFIDDRHEYNHVKKEAAEVRRILRTGGVAIFHDTKVDQFGIGRAVDEMFSDWPRMTFPAISPIDGTDFGATLVYKPEHDGKSPVGGWPGERVAET